MKNIPLLFLILFILFLFFVVYSNYSKKKEPMDTEPDDTNNELISEVQQVLTQMSSDIYESVSSLVRIKTQEAEEAVETDLNELEDVVKTLLPNPLFNKLYIDLSILLRSIPIDFLYLLVILSP